MSSPVSDLDDFLECSICLDTLDEPKILPCTHRFCRGCLQKEIERFDTSDPHASFPCPQCRGLVLLKKLDRGEEFVDQLQTDRLLRNIIESLKDDPDVCASHRMRREVVCYSCQETGCLRCAWNRHRSCSKTGDYQQEVLRIETLLNESLTETQNSLESIDLYVDTWTNALKSYTNQLEYSIVFFETCLDEKRALFISSVNSIRSIWDSFSKSNLCDSSKINNLLNKRMEDLFVKLNIDSKVERAERQFEEILKVLRQKELETSMRLTNAPKKKVLEDVGNEISDVLKLEKHIMVVRGEKLLTDNKEILSKNMQRQLRTDTSNTPSSYLLVGLITHEQQIAFDLKDEEELVEKVLLILEEADGKEGLLGKLNELSGHACPQTGITGRESYFTIVSSILFHLICNMFYIIKDSLSGLANKACLSFNVHPVESSLRLHIHITNFVRCVFNLAITVLWVLLKIFIGVFVMICIIIGVSEMSVVDGFNIFLGLLVLFLVYLLLNQKEGPIFVEQIYMNIAARHRKRRRRRNATIDYIPTTEKFFQVQRPVVITKRTPLK